MHIFKTKKLHPGIVQSLRNLPHTISKIVSRGDASPPAYDSSQRNKDPNVPPEVLDNELNRRRLTEKMQNVVDEFLGRIDGLKIDKNDHLSLANAWLDTAHVFQECGSLCEANAMNFRDRSPVHADLYAVLWDCDIGGGND